MIKNLLATSMLVSLAACSGGDFLFVPPEDEEETVETEGIPESLAQNLTSVTYTPGADGEDPTLTVSFQSLDTSPIEAVYERRPNMDLPGFHAFGVQEDALDRLFIALVGESDDGTTMAGVVGDGGQFNRVMQGAYYGRTGTYSAPDATNAGPGTGVVSYAGTYSGVTNIGASNGSELLPVPADTDPSLVPLQAARTSGTGFINADFADMSVNGAIYDRVLVDTGLELTTIVLLPTDITEDGIFFGDVERDREVGTSIGVFGGNFGGEGATSVSGIVSLTALHEKSTGDVIDNAVETGVFVMGLCGVPGDADICDTVAPN